MNSTRLNYFVSAAQCLNFTEVAKNNFISQPAISHQIKLLENELGVELFVRYGKKLKLTSEGQYFLPIAIKMLNDMEDAALDVIRYKQGKRGKVCISVAETCRSSYKAFLSEFSKENTGILLETEVVLSTVGNIFSKGFDIFFTLEKTVKNNDEFDYVSTNNDYLCIVLPENIDIPEDMSDFSFLKEVPFISLPLYESPVMNFDIQRVFQKYKYIPQLITRCNRMDDILMSVEAGVGFSILPLSIINFHPVCNVKRIVLDHSKYGVACVAAWEKNNQNKAVEILVEIIKKVFT